MADTKTTKKSASTEPVDSLDGVPPKVALKLMRDMLLFRRFEEKAEEAYAIGKIGGFCHLHTGQEGSAAGTIGALRKEDYVIGTYREHTQALAKGISPNAVMAELFDAPYPARAAVGVRELPRGARVEVDAVLALRPR